MAGKRKKKPQNIVKVDLSDTPFKKREVLPVVVAQSSKDGRRIAQRVHNVPNPQQPPLHPNFNPSPVVGSAWDCVEHDTAIPTGQPDGPDPVSPHFLSHNHPDMALDYR